MAVDLILASRGKHFAGSRSFQVQYEILQHVVTVVPWNVLLLSLCGSFDNFTVGVAFGASGGYGSISVMKNTVISATNALGQCLFMVGGAMLSAQLEQYVLVRFFKFSSK